MSTAAVRLWGAEFLCHHEGRQTRGISWYRVANRQILPGDCHIAALLAMTWLFERLSQQNQQTALFMLVEVDQEDGNVGRADAGDAACLSERQGTDLGKLLACL